MLEHRVSEFLVSGAGFGVAGIMATLYHTTLAKTAASGTALVHDYTLLYYIQPSNAGPAFDSS